MTGTPLDLTPYGGLLAALGWLYWALALSLIVLCLWLPKRRWLKVTLAVTVSAAVVYPLFVRPVQIRAEEARQAKADRDRRLAAATAQFEMRCKSAGETIKRKVENVDGVVWMKWREAGTASDEYDQFKLNDPFGRDCHGEGCIERLLRLGPQGGRFEEEIGRRKGRFWFVESIDPRDGQAYRYLGAMEPRPMWTPAAMERYRKESGKELEDSGYWFKPRASRIDRLSARYGVTWEDISTREDREHWIAGGSLKVVDLQTKEVIAERVGYMMDRGLGDRSGFRTPWAFAKESACPALLDSEGRRSNVGFTTRFVLQVLKPTN